MKPPDKRSKKYQCLPIFFFFGSGAGSVYLFYQVPGLWFLQNINEDAIRTVVSLAWVMIIPVWMVLFFALMALLEAFWHILDS